MILVRAKKLGFYDSRRVRPGVEFYIEHPIDFSNKWMEVLEDPDNELENIKDRKLVEAEKKKLLEEKKKKQVKELAEKELKEQQAKKQPVKKQAKKQPARKNDEVLI